MNKKFINTLANQISGTKPVVFCFYHAGGNARVYREWKKCNSIEFVAMELPGHGSRILEPLISQINSVAQEMVQIILNLREQKNISAFSLFGHSLGAILAYRVASLLTTEWKIYPVSLHVAGRHAPQDEDPSPYRVSQGASILLDELRRIGQTPEEVLNNEEFSEFFLPMIYSDYAMSESYSYLSNPVDIPIFSYCGKKDNYANREHMERWKQVTTKEFKLQEFPGNHFFVLEDAEFFHILKHDIAEIYRNSFSDCGSYMKKQNEKEYERGWIE